MKFVITVLIVHLTSLGLAVIGIYALQNGFIKTGGWLIAAAVINLLCTNIRLDSERNRRRKNEILQPT